jgi:hypothetical protein
MKLNVNTSDTPLLSRLESWSFEHKDITFLGYSYSIKTEFVRRIIYEIITFPKQHSRRTILLA